MPDESQSKIRVVPLSTVVSPWIGTTCHPMEMLVNGTRISSKHGFSSSKSNLLKCNYFHMYCTSILLQYVVLMTDLRGLKNARNSK